MKTAIHVAAAAVLLTSFSVHAEVLQRFRFDGGVAVAFWCSGTNCGGVSLDIDETSNTAFLQANVQDRATGRSTIVFGVISTDAIRGNAQSRLSLDIDVSTVPGLTMNECVLTNFWQCTQVTPSGTISVAFEATNFRTYMSVGMSRSTEGNLTITHTGRSETSSVAASGTVFGVTIPDAVSGFIGSGHSMDVTVER
jgi:hypothetical protein